MNRWRNFEVAIIVIGLALMSAACTTASDAVQPVTVAPTVIPQVVAPTVIPQVVAPTVIPQVVAPTVIPQVVAPTVIPQVVAVQSAAVQPTHPGPTTEQAKASLQIDVQRLDTEVAAFVWRGSPHTSTMTCATGYLCTVTESNGKVRLYPGANQQLAVTAVTARYIDAYPSGDAVHRPCDLLRKEQAFGLVETPSFAVEGYQCDVQPSQPATVKTACPSFGGNSTSPLAEGGCKFKSATVVTAVVPSGWKVTYWDGKQVVEAPSGTKITTGEATFYAN